MTDDKPFIGSRGTEITEELAEKLADEAERGYDLSKARVVRRRGRPTLDGEPGQSPRIDFRTPQAVYDAAVARAEREGKTVSEVARDALERHVA